MIASSLQDPEEFTSVFDRHAVAVHRYLASRVEASSVDDLLSEVFVAAFRSRHRYDARYADARPWLFGIATNVVRHHRRSEGRRAALLRRVQQYESFGEGEGSTDDVGSAAEAQDQFQVVRAALARLDEKHREVLWLFAGPGLSYEEIAVALGIRVGTVRSRLSRGRARLRELLDTSREYLGDEDPRVECQPAVRSTFDDR